MQCLTISFVVLAVLGVSNFTQALRVAPSTFHRHPVHRPAINNRLFPAPAHVQGSDWRAKIAAASEHLTTDDYSSFGQSGSSSATVTASTNDTTTGAAGLRVSDDHNRRSCTPGEPCWPTEDDVDELRRKLNSSHRRNLNWVGYPAGQPTAVPQKSDWAQPLYGLGNNATAIEAVYANSNLSHMCFTGFPFGNAGPEFNGNGSSDFCKAATRNRPYKGYTPSFVAFCENEDHVVAALDFAIAHELCVMVAATGHEYINRHSCPGGVMIRTAPMQDMQFIPSYSQNVSAPHGVFRFGPGITFSSAIAFATEFGRVIAGGWCSTVGLVGWSLGGGHGPLAPSLGLGVDNTLEFTVVQVHSIPTTVGNSSISQRVVKKLTVSEHENPALFWAMKGGGGSVWGIVTSITLRAHPAQPQGYPQFNISTNGTFCRRSNETDTHDLAFLSRMLQNYADWNLGLNNKFSIQSSMWPQLNQQALLAADAGGGRDVEDMYCTSSWTFIMTYIYNGPASDPAQIAGREALVEIMDPRAGDANTFTTLPTYYHEVTQYPGDEFRILAQPAPTTSQTVTGGQTSVLFSREMMQSQWATTFMEILEWCPKMGQCGFHYLYSDLTGNINSPQADGTSLNPGMRSGLLLHLARNLSVAQTDATLYKVSDYTYFSESAFVMHQWGAKYWGANFDLLRVVKKIYDPFGIFWCHHCIGDNPHTSD